MKHVILILALTIISCHRNSIEPIISEKRGDNGVTLNIPLSGSLQNPAFSPDGNSIIFTRFINGYNVEPAEIYKFNLHRERLTLLVSEGSGNVNLPGSAWNNGKIVFSSTRDPHDEIYQILSDGQRGDEILITNRSDKVAYEPTLSPNGEWIVFESHFLDSEREGVITKYKIDGTQPYVELTAKGNDCRQPNWSPVGNKILYQKRENSKWNIWIMNIDGTNKIQVTANMGNCTDASFTANGKSLVFSSDFQVNIANIYKISIDGTKLVKLTVFDGYDGAPSISSKEELIFESINEDPDGSTGTKIVIVSNPFKTL